MIWNIQEYYSKNDMKSEYNNIIVSIILLLSLAFPFFPLGISPISAFS